MVIGVLALVWALLWFRWITPDWIKIAADAYAERLLEASDELAGGEGPHAHTERVAAIRPKAAGTE